MFIMVNCGGGEIGFDGGGTGSGNPKICVLGTISNYSRNGYLSPIGGAAVINQNGDTIALTDANGSFSASILKSGDSEILHTVIEGYTTQSIRINKNSDTVFCNFKIQELDNTPLIISDTGIRASSHKGILKYAAAGQQTLTISGDGAIELTPQSGWSKSGYDVGILRTAYNDVVNVNNLAGLKDKFYADNSKLPIIISGGELAIKRKLENSFSVDRLKNSDISWSGNINLACFKSISRNLSDWNNYLFDSKKRLYLYYYDDAGNWQYKSTAQIIKENNIYKCIPDTGYFLTGFYDFVFVTEQDLKFSVCGYITDKLNGQPISNVEVTAEGHSIPVLTNAQGYYSIEVDLPARNAAIVLHFTRVRYKNDISVLNLDVLSETFVFSHNQQLTPQSVGGIINGTIIDSTTGQPVSNAIVYLKPKTVFDFVQYNSENKFLYVEYDSTVTYSFYYKNIETNSSALIKSGPGINSISETEIISKLQNDGYIKGLFNIYLSAYHSGPTTFTESDSIAKFDLFIDYIASSSIGGIMDVNIFGGFSQL